MPNNARIGGILSIVSGAFGVLYFVGTIFFISMLHVVFNEGYYYNGSMPPSELLTFMTLIYASFGGFFTLAGIIAIIGGIFALRKKAWGMALAGSIAGTITFFPCGIPAIVFVSMAKPEFQAGNTPVESG